MYKNVIYKITNVVNGKVYIGQTIQGLSKRKSEHIHRFHRGDRDHKLYLAMKKYGLENFKFEVICQTTDSSLLNTLEIYFIEKYNSFHKGYNGNLGGNSVSKETREKISNSNKGRSTSGWYEKILTSRAKNTEDRTIKYYKLQTPTGDIIVVRNLQAWCRENKVTRSNFYIQGAKGKPNKGYFLIGSSTTSSFERTSQVIGDGNGECLVSSQQDKDIV